MDCNYQHRGTNSKTHSRSGFQYADWLILVLIEMTMILVKWTAILYTMKNIIVYPVKSFVERYNECVRTLYDIAEKSAPLKYRLFLDPNKDLEEQVKNVPKVVRKHNRVYELSCDMPFGETILLNGRERIVVYLVYTLV